MSSIFVENRGRSRLFRVIQDKYNQKDKLCNARPFTRLLLKKHAMMPPWRRGQKKVEK